MLCNALCADYWDSWYHDFDFINEDQHNNFILFMDIATDQSGLSPIVHPVAVEEWLAAVYKCKTLQQWQKQLDSFGCMVWEQKHVTTLLRVVLNSDLSGFICMA